MHLDAGSRFGSYEVSEHIGSGGMGEVYRAKDTELERDVAIKVLPASFLTDTGRVARFEQEARTLAALNHPNIAQIHGIERSGATTALVMELVEGLTLADRIAEGPLPVDEALNIAMQVAAALEAAHAQGIVHRDLKPANIKIKPDGTVKVLDFGIAKALSPERSTESHSPLMTTPVTQAGVILGTAAYMSPEQARGKPVDQRADIWAFGCLLYEMLSGQLAFAGEDVAVIMARIITNDTDMASLPAMVSPAVRHTIKLCLEKDSSNRIADIRDVRLALEGRFEAELDRTADARVRQSSPWRRVLPTGAGIVAGMAGAGLLMLVVWPEPEERPVTRFEVFLSDDELRNTGRPVIDLSRDGRQLLYNSESGIVLRRLDELEDRVIPGTEGALAGPFFSADGQYIGFYRFDGVLHRTSISGGAAVTVASSLQTNLYGTHWTDDNVIFYGQPEGIYRVSADAGEPDLVVALEEGQVVYGAQLLPDGDSLLFSLGDSTNWDTADIVVQSLTTGERRMLVSGGSDARYVPTGHILYAFEDVLYAAAFDLESLSLVGGFEPMLQGLVRAGLTGAANYAVADNGTLIYLKGALGFANNDLLWVRRDGGEEPISQVEPGRHFNPRISPDGSQLAITIDTGDDGGQDIWVYDLIRPGAPNRITFAPGLDMRPVWTRDGERIVYFSARNRGQLLMRSSDGTSPEEVIADLDGRIFLPEIVLDEDDGIVVRSAVGNGARDRNLFRLTGGGAIEPLMADENFHESFSSLSPNGSWLAYSSDKTGRYEVYVRPFPSVDGREERISTSGGVEPLWGPNGNELFYLNDGAAYVVAIETEPVFSARDPDRLFPTPYVLNDQTRPNWDIHPDGDRFLFIEGGIEASSEDRIAITVVENWFEELERRVPVL